jgi:hypothetical protein
MLTPFAQILAFWVEYCSQYYFIQLNIDTSDGISGQSGAHDLSVKQP